MKYIVNILILILVFLIGITSYSQNTQVITRGATLVPLSGSGVIPVDKAYLSHKKNQKQYTLAEIEQFLINNNHLPEMQSEKEVINKGWNVTESVLDNSDKIEELFKFIIEQQKTIDRLKEGNEELKSRLEKIETKNN